MNSLSFSALSLSKTSSSGDNDILQSASEALLKSLKPITKSDVFQFGVSKKSESSSAPASSSSSKKDLASLDMISDKNVSGGKKRTHQMMSLEEIAFNMHKSDLDNDVFQTKTVSAVASNSFHPGAGSVLSKKAKKKQIELMQTSRTKHKKQKEKMEKGKAYSDKLNARLTSQSKKRKL